MSTILDSLKKSSDQRNDSDNNAMDNFNFSGNKKSRYTRLLAALIIIGSAAAISYWGYNYLNTETKESTELPPQAAVNTSTALTNSSSQTKTPEQDKKTKQSRIQKPDSQTVKEKMKSMHNEKKNQSIADLNKPNNPKSHKNKDLTKPHEIVKKELPKQKPESKISKPAQKADLKSANKRQPSKKPSKKQPNKTSYPYIYQLPFSIRKEIPKLKLNIHVYDSLVENRVAVINGEWYAIGDLIEDTLLVKDIVQNGVVLEFSGKVFLVPNL